MNCTPARAVGPGLPRGRSPGVPRRAGDSGPMGPRRPGLGLEPRLQIGRATQRKSWGAVESLVVELF